MIYDMSKLFAMQQELDERIHGLHNCSYKTTMQERTLAFAVELSELANETRCFKYWSLKGPSPKNVVIEEYVDGLHFIMSLGIALNYQEKDKVEEVELDAKNLTLAFNKIYYLTSKFMDDLSIDTYKLLLGSFINLSKKLEFSFEEVIEAYLLKNEENHNRQTNKY